MLDVDQLNRIINVQWNGDDVISVEVAVENTSSNRVAVQTNQKVKEGRAVADDDGFFMVFLRENFLRKVEGVVGPLVVAEVGEVF